MKELFEIQQTLRAPKTLGNNTIKFQYRSCEQILEKVKPILKDLHCTLTLSDKIECFGTAIFVTAHAVLKNAENETCEVTASAYHDIMSAKGMNGAQITGAASSYARKYALNGMFAIDDNKDPDTDEFKIAQDSAKQQFDINCQNLIKMVNNCRSLDELGQLWNTYKYYTSDQSVCKSFSDRKAKIEQGL